MVMVDRAKNGGFFFHKNWKIKAFFPIFSRGIFEKKKTNGARVIFGLFVNRATPKVSNAPSTTSIAHLQQAISAIKGTLYGAENTEIAELFKNWLIWLQIEISCETTQVAFKKRSTGLIPTFYFMFQKGKA